MKYSIVTLILTIGFCFSCKQEKQATRPPNILFIFTDDHALQAISAYGSIINETPNIDRIANKGMVMENAFCTNSICAPSRAVIQTGKHSHINGVVDNRMRYDSSQQTFPKILQTSGYQTAMIGKWHLKSEPTGFDFWKVLPGQGHYYNPDFRTPNGRERIEGYVTDIVTDVSLDWLEGRDKDKPFLLMLQHKAPHRVWAPGPDHLTMYDGEEMPEPPTLFDDYENRSSPADSQEMTIENHMNLFYDLFVLEDSVNAPPNRKRAGKANYNRMTESQRKVWDAAYNPKNEAFVKANLKGKDLVRWKYQRYIKNYLRCIASVDDNIGRVLDYLDESGLAENTVVIYSSDQGFYLGEHGWFDKRWMYEESLHMPFIIRWPNVIQANSRSKDLIQNIDFAETFLEMAGAPIPEDMQGKSFVPILKGKTPKDWRTSIYYHYYENPGAHNVARHYGVRTDRYKLIHYYVGGEWELFDLEKDPKEMHSVYGDPEYASLTADLKEELKRLQAEYRDPVNN